MICPRCQTDACRRSHRSGAIDLFFSLFGLRPWRCRGCELRFFAWKVPIPYAFYVHCPKCGNMDVQRIARERVDEGLFLWIQRILGIKAYRCDPCRTRFFSVRIYRRILPVPVDLAIKHSSRHSTSHSTSQTQ
jgi:hypothetical protein